MVTVRDNELKNNKEKKNIGFNNYIFIEDIVNAG